MTLSKREKVLLIILASSFILVGGGVFIIVPQNDIKKSLILEVDELETSSVVMTTAIRNQPQLEQQLADSKDVVKNTFDEISNPLVNESFDRLADRLSKQHRVTVNELSYSDASLLMPDVIYGNGEKLDVESKDELIAPDGDDETIELEQDSLVDMIHKTITLSIEGSTESMK